MHLKTPNVLFPQNLAEPITVIFSREVLEEDGDLKKRMIGTGPFILKEHNRKVRVVLARNPDYCDKGRPYVDEYVDPLDAGRGDPHGRVPHRAERLHLAREPVRGRDAPQDERERRAGASYHNTLAPFGLALAQDKPPFNDVRVRRAISMAIDRQKQVDTVFEGHGILGWGIPYIYYQDKPPTAAQLGPWWQYRPAEAKKLLAEAGHPNGFETTLFYYEYFPQMTSQVQLVQQDLKRNLNINVKITKLDYTTLLRPLRRRASGTAWRGASSRATRWASTSARTSTCTRSRRRTSSASPIRSSTSCPPSCGRRRTRPISACITKKIVDREFDQVLRMWMPYDNGFLVFQPHMRNGSAARPPAHRRVRLLDHLAGLAATSSEAAGSTAGRGSHVQVHPPSAAAGGSGAASCRR